MASIEGSEGVTEYRLPDISGYELEPVLTHGPILGKLYHEFDVPGIGRVTVPEDALIKVDPPWSGDPRPDGTPRLKVEAHGRAVNSERPIRVDVDHDHLNITTADARAMGLALLQAAAEVEAQR